MAWSAALRFTDPLPYQAALQGAEVQVLPTTGGHFEGEITKVRFQRLWMQRFHATLPQVLNIVDKSDRLAISFPTESKSPTSFYCGIEVAAGDMIVHRPDLIHKRCGDDLTRENVLKQAADLKNLELGLLLPGIAINTGPSDYFPIKQMQLSRFNGENVELIGSAMGGDFTSGTALQKR